MAQTIKKLAKTQAVEHLSVVQTHENIYPSEFMYLNPLFVEVILENIFSYLIGTESKKSISLGNYRLVCKFWDREIVKLIRRESHIKLCRILKPYPEGFGWNAVKAENEEFPYEVAYQQVLPFENVQFDLFRWIGYSHNVDNMYEKWFKIMGHQVKSLIYNGQLRSERKKEYWVLEKILKEWCPNLKRLTLKGVRCFEGLVFTSIFKDTTKEVICKNLEELSIKFEWNEDFVCPNPQNIPSIIANPTDLNEYIYNYGLPWKNEDLLEISNSSGIKVVIPKEISSKRKLPDMSTLIPADFFPAYLDGGILGQLMKYTKLKKLQLEGCLKPINRKHLMAFFHYRPNNWRTSLTHLELDWRYSKNFAKHLVVLSAARFPITTLKLTTHNQYVSETKTEDMTRFFANFSSTLEHLEFINIEHNAAGKLVLPFLPNLKTFFHDKINVFECSVKNLLKSAPNLEKCYLEIRKESDGHTCGNADGFFDGNSTVSNKHLNDFRLLADDIVPFSGAHSIQLLDWFPKLKRLELTGMKDNCVGMSSFLKRQGNSEVKHFIMSWSKDCKNNTQNDITADTELIREMGNLQNLISLELLYRHAKLPFLVMSTAFKDGFGRLSRLQSLELTNFGAYIDEKPEVLKAVENIPVVKISKMNYVKRST